jgi:hypothetical protein
MEKARRGELGMLFAGAGRAPAERPANEAGQHGCTGCLGRPDRLCAACGALASIWTEAGDRRHAVAWCARCHASLMSGRPESAEPLVYLFTEMPAASA